MSDTVRTYKRQDGSQWEFSFNNGEIETVRIFPTGSDNMGTNYVEVRAGAFKRHFLLWIALVGELVREDVC